MPDQDEAGDGMDAIDALLSDIDDPSGHQACVSELINGEKHQLACVGVADFDVWAFGQTYGGGTYELRIREIDTKRYVRQRRFKVSARVPRKADAAAAAAVQTPPASVYTGDRTIDLMLAMMKQSSDQAARSAEQQTHLLTALINRPQADNGLKFGDVINAATLMAGKNNSGGGVGEMIDAYQKLQELSGGSGGSGAASDEVELAKAFAPVLGELIKNSAGKPAAVPAPSPSTIKIVRRPRASLPQQAGSAGAGGHAPAAPAVTVTPAAIETAAIEPHEISPEENTLRALAGIVLTGLMFPDGSHLGRRVSETMDADALGALLEEIDQGELAANILRVTPTDVLPMIEQPQVAAALAQLEAYLRREIMDQDEAEIEMNDAGEIITAPTAAEEAAP